MEVTTGFISEKINLLATGGVKYPISANLGMSSSSGKRASSTWTSKNGDMPVALCGVLL